MPEQWEIVRFDSSSSKDGYVDNLDRWTIENYLRQFRGDYGAMLTLRELLDRSDPVSRMDDDAVIAVIAARLLSRQLLVRRRQRRMVSQAAGGGGEPPSQGSYSSQSAPSPGGKEDGPDPEMFDPNHDAASQASNLENAAKAGAAFCEICSA